MEIPPLITKFLSAHTCLSIAVCSDSVPYCACCFYAYDLQSNTLVFKSGSETKHMQIALKNKFVAGTIAPDKLVKSKIQGIQFQGVISRLTEKADDAIKNSYYLKYPFALVIGGELWKITPAYFKMTDNSLGFWKKVLWGNPLDDFGGFQKIINE